MVQAALVGTVFLWGGGAAAASYWTARWLWGLPDPTPDPRPLLAVLLVDLWLWFALTRVRGAIGNDPIRLHSRVAAAA